MANILIAPGKYVQGSHELSNLSKYVDTLGHNPLVLISESGYKRVGRDIEQSYIEKDKKPTFQYFKGECCKTEINRLIEHVKKDNNDVIIGVGGGKILDTAKAVSFYTNLPVVICPTIASTDAPCSALSVIYTENGKFEEYLFLPSNPNLVLMDTEIILSSPTRLTVSGIGDALATFFEARACYQSNSTSCAGGTCTLAAMNLAQLCYETLLSEGLKAKLSLEAKAYTKSVDKIIEANTLLSGIGFESAGLAGAHAIHNGFTVLDETHHKYHGEKVAFGTLTQLVMENVPMNELKKIYEFCISIGLPVTLSELGITEITPEKIRAVAIASTVEGESIHNMPFPVTSDTVYSAILAADSFGKYFLDYK